MKKILLLLVPVFLLSACATTQEFFTGYSEERYQAKLAEYRDSGPSGGYSFSVEKKKPYEITWFAYKIIQVLDDDEVLACPLKRYYTYEWEKKACNGDTVHITFIDESKQFIDNECFTFRFYKEDGIFSYETALGSKATIASFIIKRDGGCSI